MDLELLHNATLTNVNPRVEYHGEDKAIAIDVDILINDLEAGELDQLSLDGQNYSTGFWREEEDKDKPGGYKLTSPKFGLINAITLNHKVKDLFASISVESADEIAKQHRGTITFDDSTTVKVKKFECKDHGVCDLFIQIQGEMKGPEIGKLISRFLGQRIQVDVHPLNQSLLDESEGDGSTSESDLRAVGATG